ncbi:hypothetical protein TVAG_235230 [Trichomonas vaginalis G3]|uniref:Uncharacterized protein n=1 Tax=Trichomonas vaginalis (strain ATCC PRA-98 / G3) TaxID=412133 RepID=A2DPP1_TRIV3|nr:armadillo (ARM) repeat-containing protein family [Trichomonas vaginalis G3]EAY17641.1 hypothetical protein TVAG_235230 [Trichomonas vaginalis G3]KAI5486115.1 armadillo (ARM) repeat-containing protein family [Trichomonas vaginalis G3]|eukprot:XP_001329776.1 hypothetical protein [Trichomonas vaginalis G3]
MIREEDNTGYGEFRTTDVDEPSATKVYPVQAFFECFQACCEAFQAKDLRSVYSNLAILFDIVTGLEEIPFDELENIGFHMFFKELFLNYDFRITFPDALRVLNFIAASDGFNTELLANEEYFNILIDEVLPQVKRQNMPLELISNIISGNSQARDIFISTDIIETFIINTYDEKKDPFYWIAANHLLVTCIITTPYLPIERLQIISDFVIEHIVGTKILSSSIIDVLYSIIAVSTEAAVYILQKIHNENPDFNLLDIIRNLSSEFQIKLLKSVEMLCTIEELGYAADFFWPYILNLQIFNNTPEMITEIFNAAVVIISMGPRNTISAFKRGLVDSLINYAQTASYSIRVSAIKLLSIIIMRELYIPCVGMTIIRFGFLDFATDFLNELEIRKYIIKAIFCLVVHKVGEGSYVSLGEIFNQEFFDALIEGYYESTYDAEEISMIEYIMRVFGFLRQDDEDSYHFEQPEEDFFDDEESAEEDDAEVDASGEIITPVYRTFLHLRRKYGFSTDFDPEEGNEAPADQSQDQQTD